LGLAMKNYFLAVLIPLMLMLATNGFADDGGQEIAIKLREAGDIVPLAKIIADTQSAYGGEVLEVDLELVDGNYVYELEMLNKGGVVWAYLYDAKSGRLVSRKKEK